MLVGREPALLPLPVLFRSRTHVELRPLHRNTATLHLPAQEEVAFAEALDDDAAAAADAAFAQRAAEQRAYAAYLRTVVLTSSALTGVDRRAVGGKRTGGRSGGAGVQATGLAAADEQALVAEVGGVPVCVAMSDLLCFLYLLPYMPSVADKQDERMLPVSVASSDAHVPTSCQVAGAEDWLSLRSVAVTAGAAALRSSPALLGALLQQAAGARVVEDGM